MAEKLKSLPQRRRDAEEARQRATVGPPLRPCASAASFSVSLLSHFFSTRLKSYSNRIVSATLNTIGTLGCAMLKSENVNSVYALPTI